MNVTDAMVEAGLLAKVRDWRAEDGDEKMLTVDQAMKKYGFHHPVDGSEMVRAILEAALPRMQATKGNPISNDARAQFEAWAYAQCHHASNIDTSRDAMFPDTYECTTAQLAWRCWQAALASVQPSPAGHQVAEVLIKDAYIRHFGSDGRWLGEVGSGFIEGYRVALDARQPVGENPAWRDELVREAYNRGLADGLNADRQPVGQEPDEAAIDELRRFVNSNVGTAHGITRKQAKEVLRKFAALYAAPPAQAVDLGQFRRYLVLHREFALEELRKHKQSRFVVKSIVGRFQEDVDDCNRLLALIDTDKAVGNG